VVMVSTIALIDANVWLTQMFDWRKCLIDANVWLTQMFDLRKCLIDANVDWRKCRLTQMSIGVHM
jgi:hypothetical protein